VSRPSAIIVGGGLLGLFSAHYLNENCYEVKVLERHDRVAAGASQANGGLLTPSMSEPWNAPGIQWDLLKWIGRSDAPMLLRPTRLGTYRGLAADHGPADPPAAYHATEQMKSKNVFDLVHCKPLLGHRLPPREKSAGWQQNRLASRRPDRAMDRLPASESAYREPRSGILSFMVRNAHLL
jgi:hypothetical protein